MDTDTLPHTYGLGQKTKVLVKADYFCGGEADQWVFWTEQLLSLRDTGWLRIQDYKWTPYIIGADSDYPARVWESVFPHECTKEDWIPMPPQQLTVIQQLWAEVDAAYQKFNNDNTLSAEQTTQLKGYMRGLCKAIQVLMNPRFSTEDHVVAEVHKRHVMKQAGEPYQTPGVGEPLDIDRLMQPVTNRYAETKTLPVAAPKHNLPEEKVAKIKAARGKIPDDELCSLYGIKLAVLASL